MTVENQKGALAIAQAQPLENPSEFFTHGEGDSPRTHASEKTRGSVLGFAVLLTLTFSAVELIGGWFANSLALIGDAGHMLTDSMSLFFALIANRIAMKGADKVHSFGHGRVEVIAAFVNGLIMLGVVLWLFLEAFERIREPAAVSGFNVMTIALTGLIINVGVAWSLSRDRKNVNTRAALLHVMGDLMGSVAAIIAGAVIWLGGPAIVDPLLSMFVGALLLLWIGVKLLIPEYDSHEKIEGSSKLLGAIKTIIVADFVMSFDNVIAIAGAAQQAHEAHQTLLVIFGLIVSVPFIVFGSQVVLKLLDRFPIIIYFGGGLLGWIAGGMIVSDGYVATHWPEFSFMAHYPFCIGGAAVVIIIGHLIARKKRAEHEAQLELRKVSPKAENAGEAKSE